ncbi:MAG: hypothetical protein IJI14_17615 [Anaerolineaceae bacterium]|nr:hypothetical protein [Anaerolineaceae bacterium]
MAYFYFEQMNLSYIREDVTEAERKEIRDNESRGLYDPTDPQRGRISENWHDLYGNAISGYRSTVGTELDIEGGTDATFNVVDNLYIFRGKMKYIKATLNIDWTNLVVPSYTEEFVVSDNKKNGKYQLIGVLHLVSSFGKKDVCLAVRCDNGVVRFKKSPVVVFQTKKVYDNHRESAIEIDNLGNIAEAVVNSKYRDFCFSKSELSLL